jgi:hypothetical protein
MIEDLAQIIYDALDSQRVGDNISPYVGEFENGVTNLDGYFDLEEVAAAVLDALKGKPGS